MTELILSIPASDYSMAMASQDACNLSGIVKSLARVIDKIWEEARTNGLGTDYVNTHPICRLYAEQILFLSSGVGSDATGYPKAYDLCYDRMKKPDLAELLKEVYELACV